MSLNKESLMEQAFEMAKEAIKAGEVPVGCVFFDQKSHKVISRGRNRVNETKNACRHAEVECADTVINANIGNSFSDLFRDVVVYVTVEPCIMCADYLRRLGVAKIVFGCKNERFGGLGSVMEVIKPTDNIIIESGYRGDEAIEILKQFYMGENPNAPVPKTKINKKALDS